MAVLEKKEFDEFQAMFGRMLPEFSLFEFQAPRFAPIRPALDLYETDQKYVLELAAPGYDAKDFKVEVSGHTVTIWGFYSDENRPYRYHYREIPRGSVHTNGDAAAGVGSRKSGRKVRKRHPDYRDSGP